MPSVVKRLNVTCAVCCSEAW